MVSEDWGLHLNSEDRLRNKRNHHSGGAVALSEEANLRRIGSRISRLERQCDRLLQRISELKEKLDANQRELGQKANRKDKELLALLKAEYNLCKARRDYAKALLRYKQCPNKQ